jgi:hypothetical protein
MTAQQAPQVILAEADCADRPVPAGADGRCAHSAIQNRDLADNVPAHSDRKEGSLPLIQPGGRFDASFEQQEHVCARVPLVYENLPFPKPDEFSGMEEVLQG